MLLESYTVLFDGVFIELFIQLRNKIRNSNFSNLFYLLLLLCYKIMVS
uniref:Uncharacterized protein n=1 Tax=Microplitis mediator bracovirus TaxID=1836595 RepID=A0A2I6SGT8_9VIRU|nr:hypothetical protein MmBV_CKP1 [Microplitis mediator bracovirus]